MTAPEECRCIFRDGDKIGSNDHTLWCSMGNCKRAPSGYTAVDAADTERCAGADMAGVRGST
jgi:hypothetical protein